MVEHAADNGAATPRILTHLAANDGQVTATVDDLAAAIGCSPRTTRRHLAALVASRRVRAVRRHDANGRRAASRWELCQEASYLACEASQPKAQRRAGQWWPDEVTALRDAMVEAGLVCSWRNLSRAVADEVVAWVRAHGLAKLVREAKARVWSPVIRHVAAFLRWWRALRPERPRTCPLHPAVLRPAGARCVECDRERGQGVPMPRHLFAVPRQRPAPLLGLQPPNIPHRRSI